MASGAIIPYNLLKNGIDLSDLTEAMNWVDKLDGGSITVEEFNGDNPVLWEGDWFKGTNYNGNT